MHTLKHLIQKYNMIANIEYAAGAPPQPGKEAMVAPVFMTAIISEALRCKTDLHALFRGLGIGSADFDAPGMVVSLRDAITVVRRALPLMHISGAGLELSEQTKVTDRGILALGLLAAATLGEAISLGLRFAQSSGYLLRVHEVSSSSGHQTVLEPYLGDQDLQRFLVDLTFAAMVKLRRQVTAANYAPSMVEFVCPAPANAAAYEAFFACPVHFGRVRNALSTHPDWLAFPLPWASATAYRLSVQLLEREHERMSAMSAMGFTIERAIRRGLPEVADIAALAASLNVSERTLRRKLALEGLSYRTLLDESRKSRAFDLMATGKRPISQIAAEVGFSDVRAFTRAFKRWTGHPPTLIKDQLGSGGGE